MTWEQRVGALFRMDDGTWMRHANPWSGWTRVTTGLPSLILAFWSRIWLGWWAVIPVLFAILWIYLNPRIFPRPRSTRNWMSMGTLGERVWLNRDRIPVPEHHRLAPNVLSLVAGAGGVMVVWGVIALDPVITVFGFTIVLLGKLWFVDRMAWLLADMRHIPEYGAWVY
jgi:Family of unknown function (DUF6653)